MKSLERSSLISLPSGSASSIKPFTKSQWQWMMKPMQLGAILSFLGSITVIMIILRINVINNKNTSCTSTTRPSEEQQEQRTLSKIHNRILFGMCFFDIFNSCAFMAGTIPVPSQLRNIIYGASGNDTTCAIQGFLLFWGCTILPGYTAMLTLYYLAVIKYNMSPKTMLRYEPFFHFLVIIIPTTIAIVAKIKNIIQPQFDQPYCFVFDLCDMTLQNNTTAEKIEIYDLNCYWVNTSSDSDDNEQGFAFSSLEAYHQFCLFVLFTCLIYILLWLILINYSMREIILSVRKMNSLETNGRQFQQSGDSPAPQEILRVGRTGGMISGEGGGGGGGERRRRKNYEETYIQACLYAATFSLTYLLPLVDIFTGFDILHTFPLNSLYYFVYSLQGFWNALVFIRPRYLVIRQTMRDASCLEVLKHSIFKSDQKVSLDIKNAKINRHANVVGRPPSLDDGSHEYLSSLAGGSSRRVRNPSYDHEACGVYNHDQIISPPSVFSSNPRSDDRYGALFPYDTSAIQSTGTRSTRRDDLSGFEGMEELGSFFGSFENENSTKSSTATFEPLLPPLLDSEGIHSNDYPNYSSLDASDVQEVFEEDAVEEDDDKRRSASSDERTPMLNNFLPSSNPSQSSSGGSVRVSHRARYDVHSNNLALLVAQDMVIQNSVVENNVFAQEVLHTQVDESEESESGPPSEIFVKNSGDSDDTNDEEDDV